MATAPALGALLALTGPEATYARQLAQAIALAQHDAGLHVRVHIADDHADPAHAERAARELIDDPDVIAVVGPMNSWTALAAAPLFAAAGLPHITPSASATALATHGWPTFFRACPADDRQGDALAHLAATRLGAEAVTSMHDGSSFAAPLADRFLVRATALGLVTRPATVADASDASGMRPVAEWLRPYGSRAAVLIAGLESPCHAIAHALRDQGVTAAYVGTDALKPSHALRTPGHPGPWLTNCSTDALRTAPAFDARMRAAAGRHDSIYTVEAYDAARLLLDLVRAGATSRAAVCRALPATSVVGLSGPLAFDASGERRYAPIGVYEDHPDGLRYLGLAGGIDR